MVGKAANLLVLRKANGLLKTCRALAAEARWAEILAATDDSADLTAAQPQLAMQRLSAAAALKDARAMAPVVAFAHALEGTSPHKFALVRELARAGWAEDAARILIEDRVMQASPRFFKATPIVLNGLKDPDLRRALAELQSRVSKGGVDIAKSMAAFDFRRQSADGAVLGTVAIEANPALASHHKPALEGIAAQFAKAVARGRQPIVQQYEDVFVDRWGQVWTEDGQLIVPGGRALPTVSRASVPAIDCGVVAMSGTRGLYHFMIDRLPELAFVADGGPGTEDVKVLLRDTGPGFERTLLDMVGLGDRACPVGDALFVRRLLFGRVGFAGCVGWDHLASIHGALVGEARRKAAEAGIDLPARLYISRRDAERRPMTNEAELEADLRARGFAIHTFSAIPLWHQIALIDAASAVVAPHGGGLAHIVHARPGTRVIEILPIRDGTYQLRFNYARLAIIRGLAYRAWLEDQNPIHERWAVDRPGFLSCLDEALEGFKT